MLWIAVISIEKAEPSPSVVNTNRNKELYIDPHYRTRLRSGVDGSQSAYPDIPAYRLRHAGNGVRQSCRIERAWTVEQLVE